MPAFVLPLIMCAIALVVLQVVFNARRNRLIEELGLDREHLSNIPLRTPALRDLELRFIKVNLVLVLAMAGYVFSVWLGSA